MLFNPGSAKPKETTRDILVTWKSHRPSQVTSQGYFSTFHTLGSLVSPCQSEMECSLTPCQNRGFPTLKWKLFQHWNSLYMHVYKHVVNLWEETQKLAIVIASGKDSWVVGKHSKKLTLHLPTHPLTSLKAIHVLLCFWKYVYCKWINFLVAFLPVPQCTQSIIASQFPKAQLLSHPAPSHRPSMHAHH